MTAAKAPRLQVAQPLLVAQGADERGVLAQVLRVAFHGGVEITLDLEQLAELRVQTEQCVIDLRGAEQYHLAVERDGLRSQALGHYIIETGGRLLYGQLLAYDGLLQRLVGERVGQQALRFDHQEAAVGTMGGARPDHGVIGRERSESNFLLSIAEQVVVGGVAFDLRRRPLQVGVVHDEVDPVALGEVGDLHAHLGRRLRGG